MEEGKVSFVKILLLDGAENMHYEYYGEDSTVAQMMVQALADHLFNTLSDTVDNETLAGAAYEGILSVLNELRPEK